MASEPLKSRAKIADHGTPDWCHLCGIRQAYLADIWYPKNAEHDKKQTQYIRICCDCGKQIAATNPFEDDPK